MKADEIIGNISDFSSVIMAPDPDVDEIAELIASYVAARLAKNGPGMMEAKAQLSAWLGNVAIDTFEQSLSTAGRWVFRRLQSRQLKVRKEAP